MGRALSLHYDRLNLGLGWYQQLVVLDLLVEMILDLGHCELELDLELDLDLEPDLDLDLDLEPDLILHYYLHHCRRKH